MALSGFRAITYNLWHGKADDDLVALVEENGPDLLLLQEVDVDLPADIGPLRRVARSAGIGWGVALFVREGRFRVEDARAVPMPRGVHDRMRGTTAERLAVARLTDLAGGRGLVVGSLHATPLTDLNAVRRRQVDASIDSLERLGPGLPLLLAGDLNHPLFLGRLRRHLAHRRCEVVSSDAGTFHGFGPRGAFDLAIVRGAAVSDAETLPEGRSDHRPVRFDVRLDEL